jgi:hypothetical protein
MPQAVITAVPAADDGFRHPKHVEIHCILRHAAESGLFPTTYHSSHNFVFFCSNNTQCFL